VASFENPLDPEPGAQPLSNFELRASLRAAYDAKAQERDQATVPGWKFALRQRFLDRLRAQGKNSLLDAGAGPGHDALFFKENGCAVLCIDLSPELVELCRQKGLAAHVMDLADLQLEPESFDAIFCQNSLLHLRKNELRGALLGLRRVLKAGGLIFLGLHGGIDSEGAYDEDSYAPKRFFALYTDDALQAAVAPIFDILSFERIPTGATSAEDGTTELHFQALILRKG
jgi:SAM-dependent methyltransferase